MQTTTREITTTDGARLCRLVVRDDDPGWRLWWEPVDGARVLIPAESLTAEPYETRAAAVARGVSLFALEATDPT